jgi:RNA polymerase sigma-70 factor (ECF subfamily)
LAEEAALVEAARGGDLDACDALVRRHQLIAVRTAYLICGSEDEAEDAAQDAFVKAFRSLSRFRPGAPFRPWLLRIAANEARNRRRAEGRRASLSIRLAAATGEGTAPSPEAATLAGERHRLLMIALNQLREEDRLIITLRYFLDLGEEEMATALGCRRGTVKSRLSRALARLRAVLAAGTGEGGEDHG